MTKIRKAATILLGRDFQGEFEILLLKRNKALAFAGGLWVFPGGKIETNEIEQSPDELTAAKVAAVRETMEESNLKINSDDLIFYRHWTTPPLNLGGLRLTSFLQRHLLRILMFKLMIAKSRNTFGFPLKKHLPNLKQGN